MSMAKSKQQFNRLINWSGLYSASNGKGEVDFLDWKQPRCTQK